MNVMRIAVIPGFQARLYPGEHRVVDLGDRSHVSRAALVDAALAIERPGKVTAFKRTVQLPRGEGLNDPGSMLPARHHGICSHPVAAFIPVANKPSVIR